MRFVFYDVNEEKMEIITDILVDNDVRYTLDYDICYGPFGSSACNFDIIVNVEYEMWEYLKWQVRNKFEQLNKLEKDYQLKTVKHPPLMGEKKKRGRKKKIASGPYLEIEYSIKEPELIKYDWIFKGNDNGSY